jgi:hypothetical protein
VSRWLGVIDRVHSMTEPEIEHKKNIEI